MLDWDKVVQNKELLSKVEELVGRVADTFRDFPQDICDELNRLTGNEWTGDNYIEYCAEYWESWWTLEEVVFALFHDGDYPDKKEEDLYAWKIGQSIDEDAYRAVNYKWIVESGENFSFTEPRHADSLKKGKQYLWQF